MITKQPISLSFELRHKSPDNASVAVIGSDVDGRRSPLSLWSLSYGGTRSRQSNWPTPRVPERAWLDKGVVWRACIVTPCTVDCGSWFCLSNRTLQQSWLQQYLERSLTRRSIWHRSRSRACAFVYSACFKVFWWCGCKLRINVLHSPYFCTSLFIVPSHVNRRGGIRKRLKLCSEVICCEMQAYLLWSRTKIKINQKME